MISKLAIFFILLFGVIVWSSCQAEREPCLQPTQIVTQVGVSQAIETDTGIVIKDSVLPGPIFGAVDSPTVFGFGNKTNNLVFPFSPASDTTRIYIIPDSSNVNANRDTLTFIYQRRLNFISTGCGYNYFYTIKSVSVAPNPNGAIDSVKVVNGDVTDNTNVQNVKIFY